MLLGEPRRGRELLDLLRSLYDQVVVPSAVEAEVLAGSRDGIGSSALRKASWLRVASLQDSRRAELLVNLDRGEAQVLTLAQELNADLVIIDERLGRLHAKRLGWTLRGTLGVLLRAKQLGHVEAVAPLIGRLRQVGVCLSDMVVTEVLALADEP